MHVPYLDLRVTDETLKAEMMAAVERVFTHGRVLLGPEVEQFEQELARYCGVRYAVGVGSGTDALVLATKAAGLGPGDEVITSCLSFVGTANGIAMSGATPIFVDVRPDLSIDPQLVEAAITPRTKAVMPVHFTGRLADITALKEICERHGLMLIEDAAPAIGAELEGRRAGSFGNLGCLSINPMKVLNGMGEAGAVLTDDPDLYDRLVALRYNGLVNREYCHFRSFNGRIDTLQAATLLPRLARLEDWIGRRREIAAAYRDRLSPLVQVPEDTANGRHVYYTFTIQTEHRDALQAWLTEHGTETKIQHPLIIPQHPAYIEDNLAPYPVALAATQRVLCLPIHEKLSDEQISYVCDTISDFFQSTGRHDHAKEGRSPVQARH